jgi:hypothetical protein
MPHAKAAKDAKVFGEKEFGLSAALLRTPHPGVSRSLNCGGAKHSLAAYAKPGSAY